MTKLVKAQKPRKSAASQPKGGLYLSKPYYKVTIEGLMSQGLDREEAIDTLRVGLRQANGKPVPAELAAG